MPAAARSPSRIASSGTITMPPPTPNSAPKNRRARRCRSASRRVIGLLYEGGRRWHRSPASRRPPPSSSTSTASWRRSSTGPKTRAFPTRRAPSSRAWPTATRSSPRVTGRPSDVAREIVGVPDAALRRRARPRARSRSAPPGRSRFTHSPARRGLARHRAETAERRVPLPHGAAIPRRARQQLEPVAAAAARSGCSTRWGRMVLEVLPPVDGVEGHRGPRAARRDRATPGALCRRRHDRPERVRGARRSRRGGYASPSPRRRARRADPPRGHRRRVAGSVRRAAARLSSGSVSARA